MRKAAGKPSEVNLTFAAEVSLLGAADRNAMCCDVLP
jgi:hypothetical protein